MPSDITKTGAANYRKLQEENNRRFQEEEQRRIANGLPTLTESIRERNRWATSRGGVPQGDLSRRIPYSLETGMGSWGTSKYDNPIENQPMTDDVIQDTRYENQSSWDVLANGVGKMLGKAGTTFLSSLVGLPYGIVTAAGEGRWSGLWDNAVTQGLSDVDKWMEDNLVNYKSTEQQNSPWYSLSNLGSMNFWADDVITNAGFTLGAAASMAVGAGTMGLLSKSLGFVNKVSKGGKMANNLISSLFSATGEGMIEAKQGVEERNKAELVNLENSLMPERQALEEEYRLINEEYAANRGQSLVADSEGRAVDPAYEKYTQQMAVLQQKRDLLQQKYDAGKRQIEESGKAMGNKILLGNQVLLTAGNLLQFGKAMTKSYDAARHAAETSSKIAKPFGVTAERVSSNIADGYKVAGKAFGRAIVAPKNFFKEGSEEMNQQFIQSTAGAAYNEKDANDYWRAKLAEKSYREATKSMYELGNIISQGFKDSYGNGDQWEQFFIGGLTGLSGSYVPTKLFNQDKTKSWADPRRYGEWSGGVWQDIGDFNKQYNQFEENINDLNTVLQQEDFHRRMQSMAARTYAENRKNEAAANDDKKTWKDEDDKQNIHDIQAFYRAGKIDDLRAIYENMGEQLSDEDVESILKSTSRVITAEEDKKEHDTAIDNQIAEKQNEINKYYDEIESLKTGLLGSVQDVREENREYVIKQSDELFGKINSAEQEIERLKQEKDAYKGRRYFEGTYIDSEGNKTTDYNKIREDVKHNSEELQRKLDSYLESVQAVNEDTGGRLTKDQEDNLAYLHNLGKESNTRFVKILSKRRQDMPKKFLLKTNKTPEQLTNEYVASDLVFEKNDNTPEGYVEADTSLMTDNTFANFFMREVMWGGNISPEFGETADEKAQREKDEKDKNISDEERKKRAIDRFTAKMKADEERREKEQQEQQSTNVKRMKQEFVQNFRKNNDATVDEALKEWERIKQDVIDASNLLNQAGEYRRTLFEYMSNPEKVDEDKKKAEKEAAKKVNKEEVRGMSVRDLSGRDDLDALLTQAQDEKDLDMINKIKKAKVLREKRAGLDAAENDESYKGLDPADKDAAFQILRQQVENDIDDESSVSDHEITAKELADKIADVDESLIDDHIDNHAVVNIDPKTGKKTLSLKKEQTTSAEQGQLAQFAAENPEEYDKQISMLKDKIRNAIKPIDDKLREMISGVDVDDIAEDDVSRMQQYSDKVKEDENLPDIEPEKKNDRNDPVQTVPNKAEVPAEKKPIDGIGEEAVLTLDMQQSTESGMQTAFDSGQHPWFSVSGRVGYHENEPYSATLKRLINDPNISEEKKAQYRKQYKRAVAVEEFLDRNGAYTRVENGGAPRRGKVKFKVFKSINTKAEDFVIFICSVNDKGDITGVLGDLPSSDVDIDPNTEKRTGLAELYEEARKQYEAAVAQQTIPEGEPSGTVAENEVEIEIKGVESEIDFNYIGKPQYLENEQRNRQSVNELFGGNDFTIAIKVADTSAEAPVSFLDTGKKSLQGKLERDAIKEPLTGSLGQPYILIPTSQASNRNNYGRGYWAVPIATPAFGEIDKNSIFYRTVRQTLEQIRDGKLSETEAKTRLGELFGLANFHVNFDSKEARKGAGIRATTYIRQDGSEKGAPHTLHVGDRASMDVDAVLNELGRFFINVANSQINSNKVYTTVDGTAYTYNQMIGEIATTNVARPHTVNDWFTIKPVEKKGDKWEISKTPTQRIPYPSGGENALFHVSIPYQDGTTHVWTINPRDWSVTDDKGRAIYFGDSVHSDVEKNVAAIQMARAFGRYYMKDMSRPYVVQVGNQARLFDPTTNTFKTAKELEETPRYRKGASFNSLEDEYNYLMSLEADMIEGFEMAKEQLNAARQATQQVSPQQIGQDMATHLKEMGVDVELVDDANKAAEGIEDAQLLALGEKGARSLDTAEEATTRMDNLSVANEMEKAGKGALTIKIATGWERGVDGKWRYEIPDVTLKKDKYGEEEIRNVVGTSKETAVTRPIEEVVDLSNLPSNFKEELEWVGEIKIYSDFLDPERGSYIVGGKPIFTINLEADEPIESIIVHELQHFIQEREGFQPGGNTNGRSYKDYNNLAGEVEARTVSKRRELSAEERRNSLFTEDMYKEVAKEDLVFLKGPRIADINMLKVDGKILGFEHNGKLYLQKDALNPNLPMHEYTHLWDKVIKEVDPRLWNRGKELMKTEAADLWKQVAEDENYGKRWEKEGKTTEELEDLIASEIHARLTGNGFEEYTKKHPTGTFAQLKAWLLNAFKTLARTLGMSDDQIKNLTLSDFNNMTVRDFMEKASPSVFRERAENIKNSEATVVKIKADSENYVLTDAKGNENPQGAYYKDKRTGQLHARVTSVKEGDTRVQPFNETDVKGNPNPWILPSTTIGNAVDEFVRAFFAGEDVEASPLAQNLSEETKKHLKEELQKIKTATEKGGWRIVSNGIVASGTVMVKDVNGDKMAIRVAGTLDLLLYNPEKDEYAIYDMKTHRSAVDNQKELDWAAQLSLYKQLLETKFPELRGKIKALKIVPFSTSGYDANKKSYEKDSDGRLTSSGEVVKATVKYDGKTTDLTKKEMNLDISFARPGFKKEYIEGEGAQKIIVSKPQPKLGEAPKEKVKEGMVKTINKIEKKESVKTFIKPAFKTSKEATMLADKLDTARKENNLGELCLTEKEMNLLEDMLDTKKIDRIAGFAALTKKGIEVQEDETPNVEVSEEQEKSVDSIAEEKGIITSATKAAWNRLTDENKEKIVKLRRGVSNVKKELKECQRLGKDPNTVIAGYLHRKADETSGYPIIDMKKEMAWLDRVLPRLSKENKLRIVEGLIKCSDGTWSYGQMKQGLIYLASNGKEGTVYHEAFHVITQWILTDQELDRLYKAAKERYGDLDTVTLEEKLADDFMRYTMGYEPSYKKPDLNIFQKLWRAIKNMFKHTSMIDKLYRDINDGIYAGSVLRTENNEFAHIKEEDREVSMKYNFLDVEQKKRLRDGKVNQQQYEVLDADEKRYLFHCVL